MRKYTVATKISNIKSGEKVVFINREINLRTFMQNIEAHLDRNQISNINYKKVHVIAGDELFLGVMVERTGRE